ncbi:hypothetical protein L7F22_000948 [Adiantum nelumboides]|nr:hypothetical protein [Adiantum nelumboides]
MAPKRVRIGGANDHEAGTSNSKEKGKDPLIEEPEKLPVADQILGDSRSIEEEIIEIAALDLLLLLLFASLEFENLVYAPSYVEETKSFDGENLVLAFYEALKKGKVEDIINLLTTQLSWRYYGPPSERHLIKYLSGVTDKVNFCFQVTYMHAINSNVVCIEGQALFGSDEGASSKHRRTWVHVWMLKGNKLVELREYFDAILTIVTLKPCACQKLCTLWQSKLSRVYERSFPSLILII